MTQSARILAALRHGPVTPVHFQGPTVDGGTPILRVAARVQDLRDAGHEITTARAPSGIAVYKLVRESAAASRVTTARERPIGATPTSSAPAAPALFPEDPIVRAGLGAINDNWDQEAA